MFCSSSIYVNNGLGCGYLPFYSSYSYTSCNPFSFYSNPFSFYSNPCYCNRPFFVNRCYPMYYGNSSAFAGAFAGAALGSMIGGLLA